MYYIFRLRVFRDILYDYCIYLELADLTCEEDQSMNNVTDEKYRDPSRGQTQV